MNILAHLAARNCPAFFDGQRLFATDLQNVEVVNREMRWLHNKSLHQPGIGNGYAVTGLKGDRQVTVGPGYAIDSLGREVVSTTAQTLTVPPVAGQADGTAIIYYLTVAYPPEPLDPVEKRQADCDSSEGAVRLSVAPIVCWVQLSPSAQPGGTPTVSDRKQKDKIDDGLMIILARVEVLNCQLNRDVDMTVRRQAQPACGLVYVACGEERPRKWNLESQLQQPQTPPPAVPVPGTSQPALGLVGTGGTGFGGITPTAATAPAAPAPAPQVLIPFVASLMLSASINTARAGFLTTPSYTARLVYPNNLRDTPITLGTGANSVNVFIQGVVDIQDPQPHQFTALVLLILVPLNLPNLVARAAAPDFATSFGDLFKDWGIAWMGVEG
jgi:hypothetical protein